MQPAFKQIALVVKVLHTTKTVGETLGEPVGNVVGFGVGCEVVGLVEGVLDGLDVVGDNEGALEDA